MGMRLDSGSTTSLPTLKKKPTKLAPPQPSREGKKKTRRPSSAGAPPADRLHLLASHTKVLQSKVLEPGSAGWQFCGLPVADEMAQGLAGKWEMVEGSYVASLKAAFRQLRWEREAVCRYFYRRKYVDPHLNCLCVAVHTHACTYMCVGLIPPLVVCVCM